MTPRRKYTLLLVALTLLVFLLRLTISYTVEYPSYESYFTIIQAESILENGLPRYADELSYQGRTYSFNPLFYYIMALFTTILPAIFAMKVLPNIFLAALIPLVYALAYKITNTRWVSLVAAFFAGFSPLLFSSYLNTALPFSLALPFTAALLLALFDLETRPNRALLLTVLLTLLSPMIWLFIIAYLGYLLLLTAEKLEIKTPYLELAFFSFLLAFWYTLISYKRAIFHHGFSIITEYLPEIVRDASFAEFTLLTMIYAVGVVPIALASFALYNTIFEARNRKTILIIALGLVTLLAALLKLLPLMVVLLVLSLVFVILAAPGLHSISIFLRTTKAAWLHNWVVGALILLFILSSLLPALATGIFPRSSPHPAEIEALAWAEANLPEGSLLLAAPKTGFLINNQANLATVADESYLLIQNPGEVIADIEEIYTTPSAVRATELLDKYGVTHIYLGPRENQEYKRLSTLSSDRECFPIAYKGTQVLIFTVTCHLAQGGAQ